MTFSPAPLNPGAAGSPWRVISLVCALICLADLAPAQSSTSARAQVARGSGPPARYAPLPLGFEVNRGQAGGDVRFLARRGGDILFLMPSGALFEPHPPNPPLRLQWLHANPHPELSGLEPLPGKVNYLIGGDPRRWRTNIPTYARVEYRDVYPGVDLIFRGDQGRLEYDWVLQPGAKPGVIRLAVQQAGAGRERPLRIGRDGVLVLGSGKGALRQTLPHVFQWVQGVKRAVTGRYRLLGHHEVGLQIGLYDTSSPLVVDPVLSYSTYLGGSSYEFGSDVALDAAGDAYVAGSTGSSDFPTVNAVQSANRGGMEGSDAFVAKLNAVGDALLYSTYLGGTGDEDADGVAVDAAGNAYLTGFTASPDFPVVHPLQTGSHRSCNAIPHEPGDAFVAKLSARGDALVYSTCLGGSGADEGLRIAVDGAGHAYVAGRTTSSDFPTVNALQPASGGGTDAFVAELDPAGSALLYSTYLGGRGDDVGTGIALDGAGNVYIGGSTSSDNFPTVHALQAAKRGGSEGTDAFVAKLDPSGTSLVYSTYLGGSGDDTASSIAVDGQGHVYLTGATSSPNFPTAGPLQSALRGQTNAFVAKLAPTGTALVYSTYLGGSVHDEGTDLAVDGSGNAYVTGFSRSQDFPTLQAVQPLYGGGFYYGDAFVAELDAAGRALVYSTYLGGKGDDVGMGIAVDRAGNAYLTGGTSSVDFPVVGPRGRERPARGDAFVARIGASSSTSTGQPSITIDRVAILHRLKSGAQYTSVLRLRERALFVVLYHAMNAGLTLPSASIRFIHGGKTIAGGAMTRATNADGTPYFFAFENFRGKRLVGRVVAQITLKLSSADDMQSFAFMLKGR